MILRVVAVILGIAGLIAAIVGPIMATGLGWIAVEEIARSERTQFGLGLAAIEALFYPIVTIWLAAFLLWLFVSSSLYRLGAPNLHPFERDHIIGLALWMVGAAIAASVILVWFFRRYIRPSQSSPAPASRKDALTAVP